MKTLIIIFVIFQCRVIYYHLRPLRGQLRNLAHQRKRGFHMSNFIFPESIISGPNNNDDNTSDEERAKAIYETHMSELTKSVDMQLCIVIKETVLLLLILFCLPLL